MSKRHVITLVSAAVLGAGAGAGLAACGEDRGDVDVQGGGTGGTAGATTPTTTVPTTTTE